VGPVRGVYARDLCEDGDAGELAGGPERSGGRESFRMERMRQDGRKEEEINKMVRPKLQSEAG
jgi:hypothetical protein